MCQVDYEGLRRKHRKTHPITALALYVLFWNGQMSLHSENATCLEKVTSQQATSGKQLKFITIKYQTETQHSQLVTEKKTFYEQ